MARRLSTLESPEEIVKHAHTWARASESNGTKGPRWLQFIFWWTSFMILKFYKFQICKIWELLTDAYEENKELLCKLWVWRICGETISGGKKESSERERCWCDRIFYYFLWIEAFGIYTTIKNVIYFK